MIKTVIGKDFDNSKIYYKVTNAEENHHGLQFHDGLNEDIIPFNYKQGCIAGGIYFTDIKNIFEFFDYGIYIREITIPDDALVYRETNKYKASKLIFGKRMDINSDTVKYLIDSGANNDDALKWAARGGHLDMVKVLVERNANIHAYDDIALKCAASNGHLNVISYLIENGADVHARDDEVLIWATRDGRLDVVKYLVEKGADVHARDDYVLRWSANDGYLDIVKYLVEKGADIHARDDSALKWAIHHGHQDIVEYLESLK